MTKTQVTRVRVRRSCATPRGAIHLIDIENLAGSAYPQPHDAIATLRSYAVDADHRNGDLAFLAANRYLLHSIVFDVPFTCRPTAASGPDGADLALLAAAPIDWVRKRFDRIVIGSGDHCFAELTAAGLDAGLEVVVVARPGTIARIYFDQGCTIRLLGSPDVTVLTSRRTRRQHSVSDDVA
jgi:hypothetical protein